MKQRTIVVVGIVTALLALGAKAQDSRFTTPEVYSIFAELKSYQECDMNRFEKNYLASLNYPDCNEIVECALAQVTMIKIAQPQTQLNELRKKIDELILEGETPDVRYKAYLASAVFEHPTLFSDEAYGKYADGDALFASIAERLQRTLLAIQ
jgi:hypothetical protein